MLINDHTDGALCCTLFSDDLTVLVQALNAYGELCHPEIKAAGQVAAVEGFKELFELGAHLVALVNKTSPEQVRECHSTVRRGFGFYTENTRNAA